MIFRFRICQDHEEADTAQGWIVASSEYHARSLLGKFAFLHRMRSSTDLGIPAGTICLTEGKL